MRVLDSRKRLCLLLTGLLLGAAPLWSFAQLQDTQEASASPQALNISAADTTSEALETDYILGGGDKIEVKDVTMGDVSEGSASIMADGSVDLPMIGVVFLEGLTVDQAEAQLNEAYGRYFKNPDISIKVGFFHPIRYYVQGAVMDPGVFTSGKNLKAQNRHATSLGVANALEVHYRTMLTDALMLAGGLKYNADMRDVLIHRSLPSPQVIHVNVWELFKSGNTLNDVILHDQDIVEVVALPKEQVVNDPAFQDFSRLNIRGSRIPVNVIGAVKHPGSYELSNQDNVLSAIALAGGLSDLAAHDEVYILRTNSAGQVFKRRIDLDDKLFKDPQKGPATEAITLLPEDVVFVEESTGKKAGNAAKDLFDRAAGAAMFSFFNRLIGF